MRSPLLCLLCLLLSQNAVHGFIQHRAIPSVAKLMQGYKPPLPRSTLMTLHILPTDSAAAFLELQARCDTSDNRRRFLEGIVVDNSRVSWSECELAFVYSLKQDDRDWCFGLFDSTLKRLLTGFFEAPTPQGGLHTSPDNYGDEKALLFAEELNESLSVSATDFDKIATSLMIARIREAAEDELYDSGADNTEFEFGDAQRGISPTADRVRREALFKALCALRFVRLGFST